MREYYLIWDADSIPLRFLEFFDKERVFFEKGSEFHKLYLIHYKI
ncbi:hypothetical protein [Helicobacter sp. MIT 14-3879]|nr:hypothetical protein [Helicobacter sp. MIT 14-3879]